MAGGNDQAEPLYGYANVSLVRWGAPGLPLEMTGGHGFQAWGEGKSQQRKALGCLRGTAGV